MSEIKVIKEDIEDAVIMHMVRASALSALELKNQSLMVLRGQRSGRVYNIPGTGRVKYNKRAKTATISYRKYTASAPGEPPAVRTGAFRLGWNHRYYSSDGGKTFVSEIRNNQKVSRRHLLGDILEHGTSRMAPRPYKEKILTKSLPKIRRYYKDF